MRVLSDKEINKTISNVKATLAVEGLTMSRRAIVNSRKYLKGELSSQQVIDNITNYITQKKSK